MASEIEQWRFESEQRAMQRQQEDQRLARYEDAQIEERYRFKPWDPFGKPGNGAPLDDSHKRRRGWGFANNLFDPAPVSPGRVPVTENFKDPMKGPERGKISSRKEQDEYDKGFLERFGQPGAGAPLRTDSGNVITGKHQHDDLIMQANIVGKRTFLNAIPPVHRDPNKVEQYRRELDDQYFQKVVRLTTDKQKELSLERNTALTLDFKSNRKDEDPLRGHMKPKPHLSYDEFETFNPWGKGNPERDVDGFVKRHKHSTMANGQVHLLGEGEDSGEHQKELIRGQQKRESKLQVYSNHQGQPVYDVAVDERFEPYDPFGRPGAGAPRRDEYGQVLTRIPRFEAADPVAEKQRNWSNKVYLNQIKEAMKEHQIVKSEWNMYDKADCDNFAEIVDRSKVGKVKRNPKTGFIEGSPLVSTEITRPAVADIVPQVVMPIRHKYYEDLKKQVEDRERRDVLDQIRERQEANQHYDTQNQFWNRRVAAMNPLNKQTQPKRRLADEGTSNIYEAFYPNDGDGQRGIRPINIHHASSARIRRVNSDSNMLQGPVSLGQQSSPPQQPLPAYLTDKLYVPAGGLGLYGQNILQSSENQPSYTGTTYSYVGNRGEYGGIGVPHSDSQTPPHHVLHDQTLMSSNHPYPTTVDNHKTPITSQAAGKPTFAPGQQHPGQPSRPPQNHPNQQQHQNTAPNAAGQHPTASNQQHAQQNASYPAAGNQHHVQQSQHPATRPAAPHKG